MSKLDQLKVLGDAKRAARKNTPEASGTARKAPSGSVLAELSRNSVRASTHSKGLRILSRAKPKSIEPIGDGVALTSMAHPPGLIDKIADAIKSGKLSLKRGRGRPKVTGPRPWETDGVSKRTYYRRRLAEQRSKEQK
jgi:hypothetical protein